MGTASTERQLEKDRAKALRALKLWERGHDLLSISQMAGIPVGSVTKRIDLGRRLREAGIK